MKCSFIGGLFFIVMATGCSSKSSPAGTQKIGHSPDAKDKITDWEAYDASSTVRQDSITSGNLLGLWSAYEGVFRFGNNISTMKLNVPFIIEIKDGNCRRNEKDEFQKFSIKENLLIVPGNSKPDTGIINKLTRQELVISWKRDANYTRYYYKK